VTTSPAPGSRSLRHPGQPDLSALGAKIDWNAAPQRLQTGDLSALDPDVAQAIRAAAASTEVLALASKFALDPIVLVVALIAPSEASRSRSAARLAKAIFGDLAQQDWIVPRGRCAWCKGRACRHSLVLAGARPLATCGDPT
jgi:hypothetical protein